MILEQTKKIALMPLMFIQGWKKRMFEKLIVKKNDLVKNLIFTMKISNINFRF